ncbi:hypothetical protein Nepgr_003932 [Nepenthes gracilis]|uniref:Uncharacterized protein n=1 Tax=Nepenthes gracilis TaxID=150966 RepID=A0AAD3S0E8_NEPGR|nr:hypothetical protein Nepgr_003932 [Nepenthes gracilis]
MHSQLGYVVDPGSPDQPDAKLNHNPVDEVDLDLTPSSIKRISNKYSLEPLNSSVERFWVIELLPLLLIFAVWFCLMLSMMKNAAASADENFSPLYF